MNSQPSATCSGIRFAQMITIWLTWLHLLPIALATPLSSVMGGSNATSQFGTALPSGCQTLTIPLSLSGLTTTILNVTAPTSQIEATGIVQAVFSATSNTSELSIGKSSASGSSVPEVQIGAVFCVPDGFKDGTAEVLVHGLNLDQTYWFLESPTSPLNYISRALQAGHAVLSFDRVGTGLSSTPDGIKVVQLATHIATIVALVDILRGGSIPGSKNTFSATKFVGVGHSYGSFVVAATIAAHPTTFDDVVLTGFSASTSSFALTFAGLGLGIANDLGAPFNTDIILSDAVSSQQRDTSYLAVASPINIQQMFFFFPGFDSSILDLTFAHRGVLTIGELLTIAESFEPLPATQYAGGMLVIAGAHDGIVCGGNCFQPLSFTIPAASGSGSSTVIFPDFLSASSTLFPAANRFNTFIPADTGHNVNSHRSAPQTFDAIQAWLAE